MATQGSIYRKLNALACLSSLILLACGTVSAQSLKEAVHLTENHQFDQAGRMFNQLIGMSPHNGKVYYYAGENIMRAYLADSANISFEETAGQVRHLYEKGNAEDPRNPLNLVGLGNICLLRNDLQTGQQYFNQALTMIREKTGTGKSSYLTPAEKAVVLVKIAEAYIHSPFQDTGLVMPLLAEAGELDPKNPEIPLTRGDAFLASNDGNKAITSYRRAMELDPRSPVALMRIGHLYFRNMAYLPALDYYRQALAVDSSYAPVYWEVGKVYALAGQYDNARQAYQKFLELSGNNISAKIDFASVLISGKKYEPAIPLILEVMETDTSRNNLNRALAYSYYETGQFEKGLPYIEKFFRRAKPERIIFSDWHYYGKLLSKLKQDSLAMIRFLKAYGLDSTHAELLGDMGTSCMRTQQYRAAATYYGKSILAGNARYIDYFNLARAHMGLKEYAVADSVLSIANTLQPDFIPAWSLRASANASLDPETITGKAKPFYETIIEKLAANPGRYTRDLTNAYEYLGYYYLKARDYAKSGEYYNKVLEIDPGNQNAAEALNTLKKYK